jgi:uracil-DNA glycosylase
MSSAGPRSQHADRTGFPDKDDIDRCRRCDLWERATQGVAGEGNRHAALMLVGEQPGDREDLEGRPFVGPAGQLLRALIAQAGIADDAFYLTNAVKHFNWEPRGSRRIHKTPSQREVAACRDWLEAEIAALRPRAIVALGATALRALVGAAMTLTAARARPPHHAGGAPIIPTFHPSALLRERDDERKAAMRDDVLAAFARAKRLAHRAD